MTEKETLMHFMQKNNIFANNIKYIIREDSRTNIYLTDGRVVDTFHTIISISEMLPEDNFVLIKKGILVSKNQIAKIEKNTYTMLDGKVFEARKRGLSAHKSLNESLSRNVNVPLGSASDIFKTFSILDKMPAPFCVIELIFDETGRGMDFIFRYCNKEMEQLENKTIDEMLNHSFYDIFQNADRKWLVSYANVALNGVPCTLTDYSPEVNKTLTIRCFQPIEGYCACLLLED